MRTENEPSSQTWPNSASKLRVDQKVKAGMDSLLQRVRPFFQSKGAGVLEATLLRSEYSRKDEPGLQPDRQGDE